MAQASNTEFTTEARRHLQSAVVTYQDAPIGVVAASDRHSDPGNYDQVFIRDFVPAGLLFLADGETEIVRHFLRATAGLQVRDRHMECERPGAGMLPASFKVVRDSAGECLVPDYGGRAIGRVAPADSPFWWLYLLRAYVRATQDLELARSPALQRAIRQIIALCLESRFDMYPTLLVPDGAFMIDRRLGVYGFPLEIQVLFYIGLMAADELLTETPENTPYREAVRTRLGKLVHYMRNYYWMDLPHLEALYRYTTEEYGEAAVNKFNIHPESIPDWLYAWIPNRGGFMAGDVSPERLDCRFFTQGNLLAIIAALATGPQSAAIMDLIEAKWTSLVADMPMKLCYPALEGRDWQTVTGSDRKNAPWSYHNGGHWPVLLWPLAAAAVKAGRPQLAHAALDQAGPRLAQTDWPEYFDGVTGRLVGRQAKRPQTWTAAGYLLAHRLLDDPECLNFIAFPDTVQAESCSL